MIESASRVVKQTSARELALIFVLLVGGPASALIYTVITPALPQLAANFGGGDSGIFIAQMIMTMSSLGLIVGGPLMGQVADRYGARRLMLAALLMYAVTGAAGLLLDAAAPLLASRFLLGIAAAGIGTAGMAIIGSRYGDQKRAQLLGYYASLGAAVGLLSMLAAGGAVEWGGWRTPFAFYLLIVPVLLLAMVVLPRAPAAASSASAGQPAVSLWPLWPLYLSFVPLFVAVFVTTTQGVFVLTESGVTSAAIQAQAIAMASALNAVGAWAFGRVRARIGSGGCMCASLALMGLGHLLIGTAHGAGQVALGCAVSGLGSGLLLPNMYLLVIERAAESARSRAIGLMYSAQFLGSFLNPIVFAPFMAWLGVHHAVVLCGALLSIAAVVVGLRTRRAPSR